jgi:transposase InsO family protein
MNLLFTLLAHVLRNVAILLQPGGSKSIIAENLLLKQQLLVLNRARKRAPNLPPIQRLLLAFCCHFIPRRRIERAAIAVRPSTLFRIHAVFVKKKYLDLFSSQSRRKPGPKGPSPEVIQAILEFKRRNPWCGCPRIAEQISDAFGIDLDKDMVRRILEKHLKPTRPDNGPSWLTVLGHTKDSLWSIDLFRTESISLKTHWVLVVMDQYSRRIIGFAVQPIAVDGPALCRMFNEATAGSGPPQRLSFDHDPLFEFLQWKANLSILGIDPVTTVPHVPVSHPFVERLIGTIRREYLDHLFYWNAKDLQRKLDEFKSYFNQSRVHAGIGGRTPGHHAELTESKILSFDNYTWQSHCQGLFEMPEAA